MSDIWMWALSGVGIVFLVCFSFFWWCYSQMRANEFGEK